MFAILSFEGPDRYSRAGGLGSRVSEMAATLAAMGVETHLFFIGDPGLPGHETDPSGKLHLHRWCQWISRHHPGGVYDGEEGKRNDWDRSLPGWLESELLAPRLAAGGSAVVLAEEWHTTGTVVALNEILVRRGWKDRVHVLWNANNTFSFHRLDWGTLGGAATLTTVSRYMKHVLWDYGVNPRVIPNGIAGHWLGPLEPRSRDGTGLFRDRLNLVKVARWDPDKRWDMAILALARLKRSGLRPLLLARGGAEGHGAEVLALAGREGLRVDRVRVPGDDSAALSEAVRAAGRADVVVFDDHLSEAQRRFLFREADAVLANSGIEPFGLVGLEAMACGAVAMVGSTGEDYVTPGHDAIALQTSDPGEIVHHVARLRRFPEEGRRMRRAARRTAERYSWEAVIRRCLFPFLEELGLETLPARRPAVRRAPAVRLVRERPSLRKRDEKEHRVPHAAA